MDTLHRCDKCGFEVQAPAAAERCPCGPDGNVHPEANDHGMCGGMLQPINDAKHEVT